MKSIYIIGTSGFAAEVTDYINDNAEYEIKGYFDVSKDSYEKYNFSAPFLGSENDYKFSPDSNIVIAIADSKIRNHIYQNLKAKKLNFPNIIYKNCFISPSLSLGESSILCPFVTITSNVRIAKNFHANIYSYIAHDCRIGENVTFAPSVKCNGNVHIEDNVYIGTGAIIHQGKPNRPLVIGKNATIAAGAVVTKSVPEGMTVFGNPAIEFTKENIKKRS